MTIEIIFMLLLIVAVVLAWFVVELLKARRQLTVDIREAYRNSNTAVGERDMKIERLTERADALQVAVSAKDVQIEALGIALQRANAVITDAAERFYQLEEELRALRGRELPVLTDLRDGKYVLETTIHSEST